MGMAHLEYLVKSIYSYNRHGQTNEYPPTSMIIANEIDSANRYYEASYKINRLAESTYEDYHYKFKNEYFDVFLLIDSDTDTSKLMQVIICNNYYQVFKFHQKNYDGRILVSEFGFPSSVYSFGSGAVLIVAKREPTKGIKYEDISSED